MLINLKRKSGQKITWDFFYLISLSIFTLPNVCQFNLIFNKFNFKDMYTRPISAASRGILTLRI